MTREEFKKHMKRDVHQGTGRTRSKAAAQTSADIEQQTAEFLANGGEIEILPSEQRRPARSPVFNPGNFEGEQ